MGSDVTSVLFCNWTVVYLCGEHKYDILWIASFVTGENHRHFKCCLFFLFVYIKLKCILTWLDETYSIQFENVLDFDLHLKLLNSTQVLFLKLLGLDRTFIYNDSLGSNFLALEYMTNATLEFKNPNPLLDYLQLRNRIHEQPIFVPNLNTF